MRLIDADELEKSLTEKGDDYKVSMFATSDDCNIARIVAFECAEEVKNAPTIEAEPVRNGRWVDGMPYINSHWRVCSVCHQSADHPAGGHEYCGHCGAKMDGKGIDVPGKICPATMLPCCDCVPGTPCAKMDGGAE